VQALAIYRLLARMGRDARLNIGVAKPPHEVGGRKAAAGFGAHAWVECGGAVLVGASDTRYAPLVQWTGVH